MVLSENATAIKYFADFDENKTEIIVAIVTILRQAVVVSLMRLK
jgi:hypothetical protein